MNGVWSPAIILFDYDDEDEGISMDIIILSDEDEGISMGICIISSSSSSSSSSPLFIESDGNDIKAVADSIPREIKPIPVILAIQRPPLVHTFSVKMIAANNPIQSTFIHPAATIDRK